MVALFELTQTSEHRAEYDSGLLLVAFVYVGRVAFWLGALGLQLQQSGSSIGFGVIQLTSNHLALALEHRCSHLTGRLCMVGVEWL
jgi:hypothetical protein